MLSSFVHRSDGEGEGAIDVFQLSCDGFAYALDDIGRGRSGGVDGDRHLFVVGRSAGTRNAIDFLSGMSAQAADVYRAHPDRGFTVDGKVADPGGKEGTNHGDESDQGKDDTCWQYPLAVLHLADGVGGGSEPRGATDVSPGDDRIVERVFRLK